MKNNFGKTILISSAFVLLAAGCGQGQNQPIVQQKQNDVPPAQLVTSTAPSIKAVTSIKYKGQAGKTALVLLKNTHQVGVKIYSGVGEFVESIDGVKADSKHFWEFFVNGKSSNVGAGTYTTKSTDVLEWKLSAIK